MKLKDLRAALAAIPAEHDECPVIMSKDAEGNNYSPLSMVTGDVSYVAETTWYGYVQPHDQTAYEAGMTEEEFEAMKKNHRAIVLYPVN